MFIHLFHDQVETGYQSHCPNSSWCSRHLPIETSMFLSFCCFIAWVCFVWTNWMFIFVSSVLIGGSHSLPLASWLTFGLSCILALLYRWWELPRAPSVCCDRRCPSFWSFTPLLCPLPPPLCWSCTHHPSILSPFHHSCLAEEQHKTFVRLLAAFFKPLLS